MVIWNDNGLATRGAIDGFFFYYPTDNATNEV